MKKFFSSRIFWTVSLEYGADGYYHHHWKNWVTGDLYIQFAGFSKLGLCSKLTTFAQIIERYLDEKAD